MMTIFYILLIMEKQTNPELHVHACLFSCDRILENLRHNENYTGEKWDKAKHPLTESLAKKKKCLDVSFNSEGLSFWGRSCWGHLKAASDLMGQLGVLRSVRTQCETAPKQIYSLCILSTAAAHELIRVQRANTIRCSLFTSLFPPL